MAREGGNMRWLWPCRCMLAMCPERPLGFRIVVSVCMLLQRLGVIF